MFNKGLLHAPARCFRVFVAFGLLHETPASLRNPQRNTAYSSLSYPILPYQVIPQRKYSRRGGLLYCMILLYGGSAKKLHERTTKSSYIQQLAHRPRLNSRDCLFREAGQRPTARPRVVRSLHYFFQKNSNERTA